MDPRIMGLDGQGSDRNTGAPAGVSEDEFIQPPPQDAVGLVVTLLDRVGKEVDEPLADVCANHDR
jgi:hypothetical protein